MRAYFFGNMYLSSIQQGIQAAHVTAEMFHRHNNHTQYPDKYLWDWARDHKTMILLNGGYSQAVRDLSIFFGTKDNPYPWAMFHEGLDALDGAMTCVGIILPEKIYEAARKVRTSVGDFYALERIQELSFDLEDGPVTHTYTDWEVQLVNRLNEYGMAR